MPQGRGFLEVHLTPEELAEIRDRLPRDGWITLLTNAPHEILQTVRIPIFVLEDDGVDAS